MSVDSVVGDLAIKNAHCASIKARLVRFEEWLFVLDAPAQLTVLDRGKYYKRPYIGGETFILHSAYVGKRGDIIYVFLDYQNRRIKAEVPGLDVLRHFPTIATFLEEMQLSEDNEVQTAAKEMAGVCESAAHESALLEIHANDERFGSW